MRESSYSEKIGLLLKKVGYCFYTSNKGQPLTSIFLQRRNESG